MSIDLSDKTELRASAIAAVTLELSTFPQMNDAVLAAAASRRVREVTGRPLVEIAPVVRAAIVQVRNTNLDRCRQPDTYGGWAYRFPNGHEASVINDPQRPFRFEVCSKALNVPGDVVPGLTSEQVEAKLHHIASLPAA